MFELKQKVCVVTGGGTGIGRGIAHQLSRAGASCVVVTGRRKELLEETVAGIQKAGGKAEAEALDVVDAEAVAKVFDTVAERHGRVDVLVNNAGIGGPNACSGEGKDRWREILAVNLDGVFHCSREALRHMPDGGRVINISSVLGQFGVPGYTAYCTSKHGVIGFTKALALEVASRKVTVNAVCPGWVETGMAKAGMEDMARDMDISYEEARKVALDMVPLQRILQPDEIGQTCVYLASDEASGITAQAFNVCGGQVMNG